jgi:hypothetical protein
LSSTRALHGNTFFSNTYTGGNSSSKKCHLNDKYVTYFTVTRIKMGKEGEEEQKEQMVGSRGLSNGDMKKKI